MGRMPKPALVDHYGTQITVEPLMGSTGPCVDIDVECTAQIRRPDTKDFYRLTPEQALELAQQLASAAGTDDRYEACLTCSSIVTPEHEGCCDCDLTGAAKSRIQLVRAAESHG